MKENETLRYQEMKEKKKSKEEIQLQAIDPTLKNIEEVFSKNDDTNKKDGKKDISKINNIYQIKINNFRLKQSLFIREILFILIFNLV